MAPSKPKEPLRIEFKLQEGHPGEDERATERRKKWTWYITQRIVGSPKFFKGTGSCEIVTPFLIVYTGPEFGSRVWPISKDFKQMLESTWLLTKAGMEKGPNSGNTTGTYQLKTGNLEPPFTEEEKRLWSEQAQQGTIKSGF